MMKTVVFVGLETDRGFVPTGTGSIIGYEHGEDHFFFVMTAAHAVDDLTDEARERFAMRINRQSGGSEVVRLNTRLRRGHSNPANDVTIIPVILDAAIFDLMALPVRRDKIDEQLASHDGTVPGDHVFAVGLYTSHHGSVNNIPVVRTGNIAALPSEPLLTQRGYAEAYLIELRTIAGLSGSPVFQTCLPVRIKNKQLLTLANDDTDVSKGALLGVLVGYHVVQSKEDQIATPRFGHQGASAGGEDASPDERNTGFGVVIPIQRVCEIFESDDMQKGMDNAIALKKSTTGSRPAT